MDGEAESPVQRDGGRVVRVDVQHADADSPAGQVVETRQCELSSEPATVEVGIDGDHVDLADVLVGVAVIAGVGRRVDLRPAEPGHPDVAVVVDRIEHPEAVGIEPGLLLALAERVERPSTLLAVVGECAVVDAEPRSIVGAGDERAGLDRDVHAGGQAAPHLVQRPAAGHVRRVGQGVVGGRGFEHPPVDPPTAVGSDDLDRRLDELGADRGHLVAVVGVDHEFESMRVVAAGDLRVGDGMVVAGLGRQESGESVEATVDQVEIQVIRERPAAVGAGGGIEQLGDARDVVARHLALDLEAPHGWQGTGGSSVGCIVLVNQVPATWFVATVGIRLLTSHRATALLTRGRRRVFASHQG